MPALTKFQGRLVCCGGAMEGNRKKGFCTCSKCGSQVITDKEGEVVEWIESPKKKKIKRLRGANGNQK